MELTPLIGFAPDLPTTVPGVMTACTNIVPVEDGFATAPEPVDVTGVVALAAACIGGAVVLKIDGTRRTFAGTATRLYELSAGAWVDVSRGLAYTGGVDARWQFAQFGNVTIAANDTQVLQASNGAGAFADIGTAPQARIVFAVADQVMALNTVDGTNGDQGDRWWCSAIFDHSSWTPSVSTQANTGRLVRGGGELLAGLPMGRQAVAYKARAMFVGSYVGGTAVWQWDDVPGEQGAVGPDAVCDANGVHVFMGDDNLWAFDGVRAYPLPGAESLRQWFFKTSNPSFRYRSILRFERQNNRVWIFFASNSSTSGALDSAIVYHMLTKRWGVANRSIQAAMQFVQPGLTIDTLTSVAATIDGLPDIPFDSQFWLAGGRSLAVFDTANKLRTLTGSSTGGTFTTGDLGDDQLGSYVREARLRFTKQPSSASASGQVFDAIAGPVRAGGSAGSLYDGAFHLRQAGRWHRLTFNLTGDATFGAVGVDLKVQGKR